MSMRANDRSRAWARPLRRVRRWAEKERLRQRLPLHGHDRSATAVPGVDELDDDSVDRLNRLLEWRCFTTDSHGRRIGGAAWAGKRVEAQTIPDRRILLMDEAFGLQDRSVLEIGCFEGVHTVGLVGRGATVTALDGRIENVVKTIVRSNLYGYRPEVLTWDVDGDGPVPHRTWDLMHHVGVLYHLKDPVRHLRRFLPLVDGVMLDTHVAEMDQLNAEYTVDGVGYRYHRYEEHGRADPFSGLYDHAKWLAIDDLRNILTDLGLSTIDVAETRRERNGLRVLLFASRPVPRCGADPVGQTAWR